MSKERIDELERDVAWYIDKVNHFQRKWLQAEGALADTKAALRRFAVQTVGPETDLSSVCRLCETYGPVRGEAHRPDCLLAART